MTDAGALARVHGVAEALREDLHEATHRVSSEKLASRTLNSQAKGEIWVTASKGGTGPASMMF